MRAEADGVGAVGGVHAAPVAGPAVAQVVPVDALRVGGVDGAEVLEGDAGRGQRRRGE